jgi:hypothetical protein
MMLLKKKMVLSTVGVGAALLLTATTAWATSTDTDDHYNVAAGTTVTGNLKTGTQMVFHGTIDGVPITVNCTKFTASGKTPATGLVVTLSTPPTFRRSAGARTPPVVLTRSRPIARTGSGS